MKFIQNNLAKKLIIVLIVLLLFNTLYPSMSYAVDLGGILLQPVYWLLLGIYIPADLTMGSAIRLSNLSWGDITDKSDKVMDSEPSDWENVSTAVADGFKRLFIGPDTIFRRRN